MDYKNYLEKHLEYLPEKENMGWESRKFYPKGRGKNRARSGAKHNLHNHSTRIRTFHRGKNLRGLI